MEEIRIVNGQRLDAGFIWRLGGYLISTDSVNAAQSGIGYFTVARVVINDDLSFTLTHVDRMMSLADAVQLVKVDSSERAR